MDDQNQTSDNALMATNGLLYKMPQPLSVCLNKTFKKEYAQRQNYRANDTIVFDINSGASYIDPTTCMLSFKLRVSGTNANATDYYTFGTGMASNLIKEIRVLSKNGCEVDRTQNAHVLAKILKDYTYTSDDQKILSNAGLDGEYDFGSSATFVIPLDLISGFFRPTVKGMKIPAGLASGLRIEFITEDAKRALTHPEGQATDVSYAIEDPEILFMCMDLNDPTQAVLMKNSAETGLEYTFPSYFSTPATSAADRINEQVKKAVSQCTRAFCGVYDTVAVNVIKNDGFASVSMENHTMKEFQYRVGSSYYPNKMVSNTAEAWYITCAAFDSKNKLGKCSSMLFDEYETKGKFVMAVPIETDSRLNLSGLPLNNSNVLELRSSFDSKGVSLEYNIFIEHITIARTFVNQTSIKI